MKKNGLVHLNSNVTFEKKGTGKADSKLGIMRASVPSSLISITDL
jgi:hypothetical protein